MANEVLVPPLPSLRIVRSLGRGGMGEVFLAADSRLRRTVALKVITASGVPDSAARIRFEREIAAVSEVHHRNVVRLLRAGEVDGVPYAIFDRVRGRSLARIGTQPWPVVVDVGRQLAEAAAAVHAAGWIHRDLKPSNVMLGAHGLVTLIDFGLAKRCCMHDDHSDTCNEIDSPLTVHGTVVGTRHYLAPEVLHGRGATPSSDVYSLGLVLRDLLRDDEPIPIELAQLIDDAMSVHPRRRPSADAIARRLAALPASARRLGARTIADPPTWPINADLYATCDDRIRQAG